MYRSKNVIRFVTKRKAWVSVSPKESPAIVTISDNRISNIYCTRNYAKGGKGFLQNFVDNIKQEYKKDPELQANIEKFRKEAKELEDSDALKKARKKFEEMNKETGQNTEAVKEAFGKVKSKLSEAGEKIGQTEFVKHAEKITGNIGEAAKTAKETQAYKTVASGLDSIAKGSGVPPSSLYRPPENLRMRNEYSKIKSEERIIEADEDTTNVVMHKDSVWNNQWESFKNSKVGEKISNLKMQYDESDNSMVRATRFLKDKVFDFAGGVFGKTDVSDIMTEIAKIDPNFSAYNFIKFCKKDIIPNILEAISRKREDVLKDWCSEAPYTQLMFPIEQAKQAGLTYESQILDLDNVDIAAATKVDQGPVLVISFQTQQIIVVRNKQGEVVEGDQDQVMRVYHVWALCRDLEELDPMAAWKLIDQSMSATPLLI